MERNDTVKDTVTQTLHVTWTVTLRYGHWSRWCSYCYPFSYRSGKNVPLASWWKLPDRYYLFQKIGLRRTNLSDISSWILDTRNPKLVVIYELLQVFLMRLSITYLSIYPKRTHTFVLSTKFPICEELRFSTLLRLYKSGFSCTSESLTIASLGLASSSSDQFFHPQVICLSSTLRFLWLTQSAGTSTVSSLTATNFPLAPGVTPPVVQLFRVCWRRWFDRFEAWLNDVWHCQPRVRMEMATLSGLRR